MEYHELQTRLEQHKTTSTAQWKTLIKRLWVATGLTVALAIAGFFFKDFQAISILIGFLLLFFLALHPILRQHEANNAFLMEINNRLLLELRARDLTDKD